MGRLSARPSKPHWSTDRAPLPALEHPDTWLGRQAAAWIRDYARPEPFFLWVGFPGPHDPWDAPDEYASRYELDDISLPSTLNPPQVTDDRFGRLIGAVADYCSADSVQLDAVRSVRRSYYAAVTMIDDYIGWILAALEERGLLDETWVVYTSDHGEMLGEHGLFTKWLFYEPAVRVPLIVRPPGGQTPLIDDRLVELVDVSATIRDIAGAGELAGSVGTTLLPPPGSRNGPATRRRIVRSECQGFGMWRTDRYKIIVDEQAGHTVQLFDLRADPNEDLNLVGERRCREAEESLLDRYVLPALGPSFR